MRRELLGLVFRKKNVTIPAMEKRSQYDTNPLDPEYARQTERAWGRSTEEELPHAPVAEGAEAPTRRYVEFPGDPPRYQAAPPPLATAPVNGINLSASRTRTVAGLGIAENIAVTLPYIPFFIGAALAAIELFLTPRSETRVRANAAQALSLHLAIMGGGLLFRFAHLMAEITLGGLSSALLSAGWVLFQIVAFIFLVSLMVKAWNGNAIDLAPLAQVSRRIERAIEPRRL